MASIDADAVRIRHYIQLEADVVLLYHEAIFTALLAKLGNSTNSLPQPDIIILPKLGHEQECGQCTKTCPNDLIAPIDKYRRRHIVHIPKQN